MATGAIGNLRALGRTYAALGKIGSSATEGVQEVLAAQSALARQDYSASEAHFDQAESHLVSARAKLHESLARSRTILELIDISGTVRTGDELLAAGEYFAAAGQHLSRAVSSFGAAGVLPGTGAASSMTDALIQARPELEEAHEYLTRAEEALRHVRLNVLPTSIRAHVIAMQSLVPDAREDLNRFLAESDLLLTLLGADHDRQYLVLFQNNDEIRPTGGFIGSLALLNIDRGVVEAVDVQTVYDADGQLKEFIAPPAPLQAITDRWYLRDANWFADYAVSGAKISEFLEKEGGPTVDGVIAITPDVIEELLRLTGPLDVPNYDVTINADNFVAETQERVTYDYDREANRPKQFLADLAPLLLTKVFSRATEIGPTLQTLAEQAQRKQLLLYFRDEREQARVEAAGWAGRLPAAEPGFLSVVNANIGGHKSDQFIQQEIDLRGTILENGDVDMTVAIRRTHHGPTEALPLDYPPNENPAYKDNIVWQRVFVPAGAALLETRGFSEAHAVPRVPFPDPAIEVTADAQVAQWERVQTPGAGGTVIGEEGGYAYFANWQITKPGATTIGLYRYRLPGAASMLTAFDPAGRFNVYVGKQPGDTRTDVRLELNLPFGTKVSHTTTHPGVTQTAETVVYRGSLSEDVLVGVVYEKI